MNEKKFMGLALLCTTLIGGGIEILGNYGKTKLTNNLRMKNNGSELAIREDFYKTSFLEDLNGDLIPDQKTTWKCGIFVDSGCRETYSSFTLSKEDHKLYQNSLRSLKASGNYEA
jgi:hypothetical protein